jgi:hypothetical protein
MTPTIALHQAQGRSGRLELEAFICEPIILQHQYEFCIAGRNEQNLRTHKICIRHRRRSDVATAACQPVCHSITATCRAETTAIRQYVPSATTSQPCAAKVSAHHHHDLQQMTPWQRWIRDLKRVRSMEVSNGLNCWGCDVDAVGGR